jgi:hypothetical protein
VIDALVARWGADPIQWRALVRALLRIDFPVTARSATRQERAQARGIFFVLVFFTMYGFTPLIIILAAKDLLLGATVSVAISAFAVAMTLLSGEADALIASNDLQVLGHRPVSSRTYLAVRVTTLMVRSVLVAGSTSLLPAAAYVFEYGASRPQYAIALLLACQLAATATTFAIVALYTWLVERVEAEQLKKWVMYAQSAAGFIVWGGFLIVTQGLVKSYVAGLVMDPGLWLLFPPTWFAALVPLAGGAASAWSVVGLALGAASIVVLGRLIRGKLAMGYTEGLTRTEKQASGGGVTAGAVSAWMPSIRNESRAVLLLARSQIVHDMKFRMAMISLLPMTVVYMFMGGWPDDPFVTTHGSHAAFVQMVVMFLPILVRQVIVQSESHRAGWIFHTTPARRATLLSASRNVTAAVFLLPYLAVLAAFFAWAFGSTTHALLHVAFMGLLAALILQFDVMLRPQLPFSVPPVKDAKFGGQMVTILVGTLAGTGLYFFLTLYAYRTAGRMLAAAACGVALIMLMEMAARWRIGRRSVEELYFE